MATHADAQLILQLYDIRREAVCREARKFFASWRPTSAEEIKELLENASFTNNAYLRQSTSYWEMAFSLVNTGAIDEALFAKNCGEGVFFAVKCQAFKERFPEVWNRTMPEAEAFIARNTVAQQKAEMFRKRVA